MRAPVVVVLSSCALCLAQTPTDLRRPRQLAPRRRLGGKRSNPSYSYGEDGSYDYGGGDSSYSYDSYDYGSYDSSYGTATGGGGAGPPKLGRGARCKLPNGEAGFLCSDEDSTCIPGAHRCDAVFQCPDNSDEHGCHLECLLFEGEGSLKCADGKGCVGKAKQCDGHSDCADGSDELGCGFECTMPQGSAGFECSDKKCIHESQSCDGKADCADGSDEMSCGYQCVVSGTDRSGWLCSDGTCIEGPLICDGNSECAGGEDEKGCEFECTDPNDPGKKGWYCNDDSGDCTFGGEACDGKTDCASGADEMGCGLNDCVTERGVAGWRCLEKDAEVRCIDDSQVCDGVDDCSRGSDEANCQFCDAPTNRCPYYYLNNGLCDASCLTRECGYDRGDCGSVETPDQACEHCKKSKCAACFDDGPGGAWCELCGPCEACFGGKSEGGCSKEVMDGSAVAETAARLHRACAGSTFSPKPTCPASCASELNATMAHPCWLHIRSASAAGIVEAAQQVCRGACVDDVDDLAVEFLDVCHAAIARKGAPCDMACLQLVHKIDTHACGEAAKEKLNGLHASYDRATACTHGEDEEGACPAYMQDFVLSDVRAHCRAGVACSPECAASLVRARQDLCWSDLYARELRGERSVAWSVGGQTPHELAAACPLLETCSVPSRVEMSFELPSPSGSDEAAGEGSSAPQRPSVSDEGVVPAVVSAVYGNCQPAFAPGAGAECPDGCEGAIAEMDGSELAPTCSDLWHADLPSAFLQSVRTMCKGGCNAEEPALLAVVDSCGVDARRAANSTCPVECEAALDDLNRSAVATHCDARALLPRGMLDDATRACGGDSFARSCVRQFGRLVSECGLSLHTLRGWGAAPTCTDVCAAKLHEFSRLACGPPFLALTRAPSGKHLRVALARLQKCRASPPNAPARPPRSAPPNPPPPSKDAVLAGYATSGHGYYQGCLVFLDLNGNGVLDVHDDELFTLTLPESAARGTSAGYFELKVPKQTKQTSAYSRLTGAAGRRSELALTMLPDPPHTVVSPGRLEALGPEFEAAGRGGCVDNATRLKPTLSMRVPAREPPAPVGLSPLSTLLFSAPELARDKSALAIGHGLGLPRSVVRPADPADALLGFEALKRPDALHGSTRVSHGADGVLVLGALAHVRTTVTLIAAGLVRAAEPVDRVKTPPGKVESAIGAEAYKQLLLRMDHDSVMDKDPLNLQRAGEVARLIHVVAGSVREVRVTVHAEATLFKEIEELAAVIAAVNRYIGSESAKLGDHTKGSALVEALVALERVVDCVAGTAGCPSGDATIGWSVRDCVTSRRLGSGACERRFRGIGGKVDDAYTALHARGCTDKASPRYNPSALVDDGSCTLLGELALAAYGGSGIAVGLLFVLFVGATTLSAGALALGRWHLKRRAAAGKWVPRWLRPGGDATFVPVASPMTGHSLVTLQQDQCSFYSPSSMVEPLRCSPYAGQELTAVGAAVGTVVSAAAPHRTADSAAPVTAVVQATVAAPDEEPPPGVAVMAVEQADFPPIHVQEVAVVSGEAPAADAAVGQPRGS